MTGVLLSKNAVDKRGLFDARAVEKLLSLHQRGQEDLTDHLMTLMTLEIWCRIFLDGRGVPDVAEELVHAAAPTIAAMPKVPSIAADAARSRL